MRLPLFLFFLLVIPTQLLAVDFSFHQNTGVKSGPTLLVIGGVDGDEPGGFHAAATLVTRYRIEKGNLWIVPNLNSEAILKRVRGDMNLKFAAVSKSDPQYASIKRIKSIITESQVDLILNLHDGSGFYHPTRINSQRNPNRWGQSCVIDQKQLPGAHFGQLQELAETAIQQVNKKVQAKDHYFQLKNMNTASTTKDIPAKKSLSFFAVSHNKPTIAVEASKKYPVHLRTYYHLEALESFMQQMGITFRRDFPLTPAGVKQVIKDDALISLAEGRIQLELNNMRTSVKHFPLAKTVEPDFSSRNPLITLQPTEEQYRLHYGNNRLAFLDPLYVELDRSIEGVEILIDGVPQDIPFGSIVPVQKKFLVNNQKGYRVNVIGFAKSDQSSDGHFQIGQNQLNKSYSIDKAGQLYRVEVYKGKRFSGMVLVDFRPQKGSTVAHFRPVNPKPEEHLN
ncbi:M99 family carboxypeptidase catalytic domain-containing protein [uncultured Desulfuromusa sp.]|uniref:M99 family carboxypeptidase catalytic domain-containing protein n=1 Tax=uncultured Desulfuromusa sp. TaxID=219183 RepID=UPI002AA8FC75|nr:M99 family carboxypeptidase catalytic domain-containing protein [uncultured Desulfuromusa sp.]